MTIDVLGVQIDKEQLEALEQWLKNKDGSPFWWIIDKQAADAAERALAIPPLSGNVDEYFVEKERNCAVHQAYRSILAIEKEIFTVAKQTNP